MKPIKIAIVAGEASGDLLGAALARAIIEQVPGAELVGVCGPAMRAAGVRQLHDCSELSVMGIAEVFRHLPRLLRFRSRLRAEIEQERPSVLVGIDAPDFNLGLERTLRSSGIPTVHYVSPSIWAWREKRAAKVGRAANRVLCLFPMEPPIYERYGVKADLVGHPLAEQFPLIPDAAAARTKLKLDAGKRYVALLPGSRLSEISRLGTVFLLAAARLLRRQPSLHFVAPMATPACRALFESQLAQLPPTSSENDVSAAEWTLLQQRVRLIDGQSHAAMIASDFIILASGTAALEAMLAKRPMVVAYKVAPLTYFIAKTLGLVKINRYSLPNILAGTDLVPERMQDACTPRAIADAMSPYIENPALASAQSARFTALHETLQGGGAAAAAKIVLEVAQAAR